MTTEEMIKYLECFPLQERDKIIAKLRAAEELADAVEHAMASIYILKRDTFTRQILTTAIENYQSAGGAK